VAVTLENKGEREKLSRALVKLSEEDPTFMVSTDSETAETIISGMGELHLEIILDRLKREFSVDVITSPPRVAYRETITSTVDINEKLSKQTGGKGQYAHVIKTLSPMAAGHGFDFKNNVKGGNIPREYIPAIEKGIVNAMARGIMADFPVVDIRVTLHDGSFHEVDSSEMAFRKCAASAFRKAFMKGNPQLLEPVMSVSVTTPEEYAGNVTGSVYEKRGKIIAMDKQANAQIVKSLIPLSGMFGYATELRNMSQGRAAFAMHFEHYEAVPFSIAEKVMEELKKS
jgi:elongation factor G